MKSPMELLGKTDLKKHVAAIHTDGLLSELERKTSNVLLLNAYDDLLSARKHEIEIKTLAIMLGYDSKNLQHLKSSMRNLTKTTLEWNILDDKGRVEEWTSSSILAHVKIKRNGLCEYSYSAELAEKLYQPETYATINISMQKKVSGGHAFTLYENCVRFLKTGSTGWIEIDKFRKMMGVLDKPHYDAFFRLNSKLIKPAIKTVNSTSDLKIELVLQKHGRRVTHLKFLIKPNPQLSLFSSAEDNKVKKTGAFKRAVEFGISDKLACRWVEQNGEDYVNEKLDYTEIQEKAGAIKNNASGFLTKAIEDDYKSRKQIITKKNKNKKKQSELKNIELGKLKKLQETKLKVEQSYRAHCKTVRDKILQGLSDSEKNNLKLEFLGTIETDYNRSEFEATGAMKGWNSVLNNVEIRKFWVNEFPYKFMLIDEVAKNYDIENWQSFLDKLAKLENS